METICAASACAICTASCAFQADSSAITGAEIARATLARRSCPLPLLKVLNALVLRWRGNGNGLARGLVASLASMQRWVSSPTAARTAAHTAISRRDSTRLTSRWHL